MARRDVRLPEKIRRRLAQMGLSPDNPNSRPSDMRFRSFAERYTIERASTFREAYLMEDTWRCIQDAKRAYKQIEAVGRTIAEET